MVGPVRITDLDTGHQRPGRAYSPRAEGRPCSWFVGAVAACLVTLASCSSPSAPATTGSSSTGQSCAWPWEVNIRTDNTAFPDAAALYWGQPIVATTATQVSILGSYPDARAFTLSVYTPSGAPFTTSVGSSLADYQIAPEPGSTNPWQSHASPGGRFQVTIRSSVTTGQANVLPLPLGGSELHPGYLVYRVYVPSGGSNSKITLPTITISQALRHQTLALCQTHAPVQLPTPEPTPGGRSTSPRTAAPPSPGAFYEPAFARTGAGLPNTDIAYAEAYVLRPAAADVLVVTAKAPTFAPGESPSPWPAAGEDMRYWSMCMAVGTSGEPTVANTLPDGEVDYGCRADDVTKLNPTGNYSYVIGSEAQNAAIAAVPGATFLPFSSTQTTSLYLLLLRYLLVNPTFPYSTQGISQTTDPSAAATAMGPYYPKVSSCALSTLMEGGLSACEAE
jgi:hypothetical protein